MAALAGTATPAAAQVRQFTTVARFGAGCGAPLASVQLPGFLVNGLVNASVATDDAGNAWLRLRDGSLNLDRLRRLSPAGAQVFDVPIDTLTLGLAVGTDQRVWSIRSDSRLNLFDTNGALLADFGSAIAGLSPIALDTNLSGDVWVLNSASPLQILRRVNRGGGIVFSAPLPAGATGRDVGVSDTGEAWVACGESGSNPDTLRKYSNTGTLILTVTLPAAPITRVLALDVDQFSNVAVITLNPTDRFFVFTNNGAPIATPSLPAPAACVTFTGGGNIVVSLPTRNEVRRFSSAGVAQCTTSRSFAPGPLGGPQVTDTFWVATTQLESPVPRLDAISPTAAPAGRSDLPLQLDGANFGPSRVLWRPTGSSNAEVLAITSITATRIVATVPARLLASPGSATVFVENVPQGGGTTQALPFTITGTTGSVTPFGAGCRGSNNLIPTMIAPNTPRVGTLFTQRVGNVPGSALVILGTGGSRTSWQGVGLPASLAGFGAPQCSVLVAFDLSLTRTAVAGTATFDIALPTDPGLVGAHVFQQGFVLDAGANALGATLTPGADIMIGNQ